MGMVQREGNLLGKKSEKENNKINNLCQASIEASNNLFPRLGEFCLSLLPVGLIVAKATKTKSFNNPYNPSFVAYQFNFLLGKISHYFQMTLVQ
jgi:hypothetical protein